jgi:predicted nucleic acid-binding protein
MSLFLVDTNVVIRAVDRRDSQHRIARAALRTLRTDGHTFAGPAGITVVDPAAV